MKEFLKNDEMTKDLENKDVLVKFLMLIFGVFISALSFNLFFVPNNFVSSGLTGISVILSHTMGIEPSLVILIGNIILILICLLCLGGKKSLKQIIGAILFTAMIYATKDIPSIINFSFDNIILYVVAAGVCLGFGESLVYKAGFSTGGTAILAIILCHYIKKPLGKMLRIVGYIIILIGGFTFGYTMVMYSLLISFIATYLIDKLLLGISDSKMFMIQTTKEEDVENFIIEVISSGVTIFNSKGAFSNKKKSVLMCVVPTEKYTFLKNRVKEIDPHAFIIVSDCYEVHGGTKKVKTVI